MKTIKIFWQEQCPSCPPAKRIGEELKGKGNSVEFFNVKEIEGLSQAVRHSVMATPSVIIVDEKDKEIAGWRSLNPTLAEVENYLN